MPCSPPASPGHGCAESIAASHQRPVGSAETRAVIPPRQPAAKRAGSARASLPHSSARAPIREEADPEAEVDPEAGEGWLGAAAAAAASDRDSGAENPAPAPGRKSATRPAWRIHDAG